MTTRIKLGLAILAAGAALLANIYYRKPDYHSSIHYHAGFVVYVDGVQQDLAETRYMNYSACSEHDYEKSAAEEQVEKAHLHDMVGDVVHVHRTGAVWRDLLTNIKLSLPGEVVAIIEGQLIENPLDLPIEPEQSIVLFVGERPSNPHVVATEHIREVGSRSELCN
jgi:hypothetical protein